MRILYGKKTKPNNSLSASISTKPLLKREVTYPFNFAVVKSFRKKSNRIENTKINVIQLV